MKMNSALRWAAVCVWLAAIRLAWADTTATLEEIVVTAQKREENVTQVPISITVVSTDTLRATASKNLSELQGVVPGVTFQGDRSFGGTNIAMRGTSGATTPLQDDPVAVYVDGVYVPPNSFAVSGLTDLNGVEVIRGPQGTLQGRNATAGAVLVRTADPESTPGGYIHVSGADPAQFRAEGAVTGPIGEHLSVRLSAYQLNDRGWAKNDFNDDYLGGATATSVRGVALWKAGGFKGRLMMEYEKYTAHEALARWAQSAINPTGVAITVPTPALALSADNERALENGHFNQDIASRYTLEAASSALELSYDFGPAELVSVSGANRLSTPGQTDTSGLALLPRGGYNMGNISGNFISEELRLQSTATGSLRWLAGAYASKANGSFFFNIYNLQFTAPGNTVAAFAAHQGSPTVAGFADLTYNLISKLSLGGGVRYTTESKTFRNTFAVEGVPSGATLVGPFDFNPPRKTWNDTSYRAILNYTPTDDSLVYLSYSRGFKSGGFNAFTVRTSNPFNPEVLKSAELGAKADLLQRRVHVAASVYRNAYDNLQVTSGVPTGGVVINNAATATIRGFEVEGKARITDSVTVEANAAYTDGKYDHFANAPNIFGVLIDASGNRLTSSPLWQYFLQTSYACSVGADWSALAQLNWRWRDKLFFSATDQNLGNLQSTADGELGARLRLENGGSRLWFALYGANLTDKRAPNTFALAFNYPLVSFNRPRTVGMEVGKEF